jgi:hypothetical protein
MIYFVSDASPMISMATIKAVLPIGIGLASAAYLTMQVANSRLHTDKVSHRCPGLWNVYIYFV